MENTYKKYEILCVDSVGNCIARNEKSLCFSLLSNSDLLGNSKLRREKQIECSNTGLTLEITKITADEELKDELRNSFLIKAQAPFDVIEPLRIKLLTHLKDMKFEHLYVLTDEASSFIADSIYPKINSVENALRRYLIKFLVTKLGPNWWSVTADSEMKTKVIKRKNNESTFSSKADSKAYLIDFGELGKIVYSQSSGFISKDDIFTKVMEIEETPEAISALKVELQSNYNKFFRETFKDKGFQQKWEELEKIRHKVAHNSLFTNQDLETGIELSDEVLSIIHDAEEKIDGIKFSHDERDAIRDRIERTSSLRVISDEEMLEKIESSEVWASEQSNEGFIGLRSFVMNYLGNAGYDFASSYSVIERLQADGKVEIYERKGAGHDRPVKALRIFRDEEEKE